jgi:pyrroloquinoline quinone biosynthesis protein B
MSLPVGAGLLALATAACSATPTVAPVADERTQLVVLGIAQDGGHPQAGCAKACCAAARRDPSRSHAVTCLALVEPRTRRFWLFEATPDLPQQLWRMRELHPDCALAGIFVTHAHVGHYTGLMHLGREAMGTERVPVYVLPRLAEFLATNGPWSQLVRLANVELHELLPERAVELSPTLRVTPFTVPHRDEYSETAGFRIEGATRAALFIPDIDKWERWDRDVREEVRRIEVALVDGTFFQDGELARDMSAIPHPFVAETLRLFAAEPASERAKLRFLHLNHTNPLLDPASRATRQVAEAGSSVARELERHVLEGVPEPLSP